jgi:hypothetical protein
MHHAHCSAESQQPEAKVRTLWYRMNAKPKKIINPLQTITAKKSSPNQAARGFVRRNRGEKSAPTTHGVRLIKDYSQVRGLFPFLRRESLH